MRPASARVFKRPPPRPRLLPEQFLAPPEAEMQSVAPPPAPGFQGTSRQWLIKQQTVQEMLADSQQRLLGQLRRQAARREQQQVSARERAEAEEKRVRRELLAELERKKAAEDNAALERAARGAGAKATSEKASNAPPQMAPEQAKREEAIAAALRVSDDQLRAVHQTVKQRLETTYGGVLSYIRRAFLFFDQDNTGSITPEELAEGLLALNVNVPKHMLEHMINVCDINRDGEIGYKEWARIMSADDITEIKVKGAEEEGLVLKAPPKEYLPGILVDEVVEAHGRLKEFLNAENSRFRAIFRKMDEDKNGWADRHEMMMLPLMTGTEPFIRPALMKVFVDFMDIDGDERILYKEFVKVFTADDVSEFFKHGV